MSSDAGSNSEGQEEEKKEEGETNEPETLPAGLTDLKNSVAYDVLTRLVENRRLPENAADILKAK